MANETIFPKGIRTFKKHDNAPDFVLGTIVLSLSELQEWLNSEGKQYATEYKGVKQIRLQATKSKDGNLVLKVDTWKPTAKSNQNSSEEQKPEPKGENGLPF